MEDNIIYDGKGVTVELWQNAKGGTQGRIKVVFPDLKQVEETTLNLTKWLKTEYNIELKG